MPASTPQTVPFPYHVVMDAIPRILPSLGFAVVSQDLTQGLIKIRGTGTVMAAGENLTIRVGTNDPAYSVVQIDSGIRLGILTYSRTTSNFDQIFKTLWTYLHQYYSQYRAPDPAGAAPPPPPAQQPGPPPGPPPDPTAPQQSQQSQQ